MQQNKLLINLKKCTFMQKELVYLGFVIAKNEMKMDSENIAAIVNWPSPKSLFEASQPFRWTDATERIFQLLKKKITEETDPKTARF